TSLAYTAPPVSSHLSLHDALPICEGADRPARPEEGACRRDDRERGGALGELKHHLRALALGEREDLADGTREESHEHRRREDLDVDARLVPLLAEYGAQLPTDGQGADDRHDAERRADRERAFRELAEPPLSRGMRAFAEKDARDGVPEDLHGRTQHEGGDREAPDRLRVAVEREDPRRKLRRDEVHH